ncbi:MAG TPA: S8 family serine peptidase, partial [Planctomycetota bacterium]|nr:S8 family serine peptidase [Planctomycetota bacterium]
WHLSNTGQFGGLAGADIEALPAWAIRADAPDVVIAVIDSGTDYAHPEFEGRLLQGFDCVEEDEDATALHPHGIYVAGLIGAKADNAFGVAGVVRNCQLLPVRVLSGLFGTTFNLAQGIDYATSQGADIFNLSLIEYPGSTLLINALNEAAESGAILIGSAGNNGVGTANSNWPSASPVVMAIGATDLNDERASFSATGTVLDFVAPGDFVFTVSVSHDDSTDLFGGTSAAAPIAAGIAALLKSYDPYLTPEQIYVLLKAGAEDQVGAGDEDVPGWDPFHGHGRLNAFRSLQALCSCQAGALLTVSPPKLGFGAEGTWLFRLSAGAANGRQPYLILGTLSGPGTGFTLGQTHWPLSFDAYTRLCLLGPSPIVGGAGSLDAAGEALATLTVPAAARETLAGLTLHHAAAVYDGSEPHPIQGAPLLLSEAVASGIHGLPERLLLEDFEGGAPAWVIDNGAAGQWHIAPPGECGAPSQRAAYNGGEPGCAFVNSTSGRLISPSVTLTGVPPFRIRFSSVAEYSIDIDDPVRLSLVDDSPSPLATKTWLVQDFGEVLAGTESSYEIVVTDSLKYEGRVVHLEAQFVAPVIGAGSGWMLDDVALWNSGAE